MYISILVIADILRRKWGVRTCTLKTFVNSKVAEKNHVLTAILRNANLKMNVDFSPAAHIVMPIKSFTLRSKTIK